MRRWLARVCVAFCVVFFIASAFYVLTYFHKALPSRPSDFQNAICETPVFNFGEREIGETITHSFMLRNTGKSTIKIIEVKPACSCTVADVKNLSIAEKKR